MLSKKGTRSRSVFVTVGTTGFDDLTRCVMSKEFMEVLSANGYDQMTVQVGNGIIQPAEDIFLKVDSYRYKSSIEDDIKNADLVISHAGAGSVLETLKAGKPLIVVVNEKLMNNHQSELAEAFAETKNLLYCSCKTLAATLRENNIFDLADFPDGNSHIFGAFMDEYMGVK